MHRNVSFSHWSYSCCTPKVLDAEKEQSVYSEGFVICLQSRVKCLEVTVAEDEEEKATASALLVIRRAVL